MNKMITKTKIKDIASKVWKKLPLVLPITIGIIVGIWCILFLLFLAWGLLTSVKDPIFFLHINPFGISIPKEFLDADSEGTLSQLKRFNLTNYSVVFERMHTTLNDGTKVNIWGMVKNSLLYCGGNALFSNMTLFISTYILSKYKHFRSVQLLWWVYIFTNWIPLRVDLGSEIKLLKNFGIYNSMLGNWLYNCGAFGGNFLLVYGAWNGIGKELMEAAHMDGAGTLTIFFKIMLPQMAGLFLVMVLNSIVFMWDDYMPMITMLPSYPSVASGAFNLQFAVDMSITVKMAGLVLLSLPMVVMYFALKSKMIKAMSSVEGLKG